MEVATVKLPYFYTGLWFNLYNYTNKYPRDIALKMLLDHNFNFETFSPYFQVSSVYINDLKQLKLSLNPNYFNHIDIEGLNDLEKKIVYSLSASIDLRINKCFVDVIVENIIKEENIKGEYAFILGKNILNFMLHKNKEHAIKSILCEVFLNHILYKNIKDNTLIVYLNCYKDKEKSRLIKYIKKYFLNYDEKMNVFWDKHFTVISHNVVSKIDQVINY